MGFRAWLSKLLLGFDTTSLSSGPRKKTLDERVTALEMTQAEVISGYNLMSRRLMPKMRSIDDDDARQEESAADSQLSAALSEVLMAGTPPTQEQLMGLVKKYPLAAKKLIGAKGLGL